jgi:hypothetical protein
MAPSHFKVVVRVGLLDVRLTRDRPGIVTDFVASTVLAGLRHSLSSVKSAQRRTTRIQRRSLRSGALLGQRSLPKQLDHGGALIALAGRVHGVQPIAEGGIRLRVQVAVAVKGEAHRGMPGSGGDFLGVGAGRDPQGDGRVAKVVDTQALEPGVPGRWPPDASAEGDHPQRPTLRGGEHEGVRRTLRCQVGGQLLDYGPGQADGAAAGAGLGWPYAQPATYFRDDLGDLDRASQQVDPAAA